MSYLVVNSMMNARFASTSQLKKQVKRKIMRNRPKPILSPRSIRTAFEFLDEFRLLTKLNKVESSRVRASRGSQNDRPPGTEPSLQQ